jgi:pyruvate,water dikinase
MTTEATKAAFLSPFDFDTPEGAEGWEDMYTYYVKFGPERREFDEGKFWFQNSLHFPDPLPPFDMIVAEACYFGIGQFQSRVFSIPNVLGIEHRVLNGYVYITANQETDPEVVQKRLEVFQRRAGFYYSNWNELEDKWRTKVLETIETSSAVEVPDLPELEAEEVVTEGRGIGSNYRLVEAFDRIMEGYYKINQLHFEMHLLGFGAYLVFFEFCRKAFPDIPEQTMSQMVSGLDSIFFRPDDELKELARLAIELDVAGEFAADRDPDETIAALGGSDAGSKWLASLEERKDPWFNMTSGEGMYHYPRAWKHDLRMPFMAIAGYIERIGKGEDLARPLDELLAERDRIAAEYEALLPSDEERGAFREMLGLAQMVFPHMENHRFYIDQWSTTVFFDKIREVAQLLTRFGLLDDPEDVFMLKVNEVRDALSDLGLAWAGGTTARGVGYWPPIVARRKEILERLAEWAPPPALGTIPEVVHDPTLQMLWGVTAERLRGWIAQSGAGKDGQAVELTGYGGSPGIVEGLARVVRSVEQIGEVQEGEVLVCPLTSPSWGPIFPKIVAAVADAGGMMSHAAIVAREYGLPAVVGTGQGTRVIKTGQRLRVDGAAGTVTVVGEA